MKHRNYKILIVISIILVSLIGYKKINASETADWEFLPLGINYLSNDNFSFTQGGELNQGTLSTINYIRVNPSTKYYLYFYRYQEGRFLDVLVSEYGENKNSLGSLGTDFSSDRTVVTFTTGANCKYIIIDFDVEEEWGAEIGIDDVENNYILADHSLNINSISSSDIKYKGPNIDYSPVLSGVQGYYITNVNDPISKGTILSGIKAYDDNDGDLTDEIVVSSDTYSSNKNKVGTWKIILSVSDYAGNTSTFTINITVVDTDKPRLTGTTSFKVKTTDNYSVSSFFNDLEIIDNYDGNISQNVQIINDNYTPNKTKAGTYIVNCYIEDSSDNRLDFSFSVEVEYVDKKAPVFSGKFSYEINKTDILKTSTILTNVQAIDDLDGDISKNITIKYDYYSKAPSRVGTWKIVLTVTDKAGNEATQEISITVKDNISPVFYVDTKVITIDLQNNTMSINDIVDCLIKSNNLKKDINYYITYDEYSDNENTPGDYKVVLEMEGKPIALNISVLEHKKEKKTFFEKVLDFFISIFNSVGSFFKRIF